MRALILCTLFGLAAGCSSKPDAPPNVVVGKPDDTPQNPTGETVENPTYKLWAKFPVGTTVTQKTTTENEDNVEKTVTTIVYTLKEKTDEHVAVESKATTVHYTGRVEENPPDVVKTRRLLPLPPGVKKEDWGKPKKGTEQGEETVSVLGKEYKTRWNKSKDFTEAGELTIQTWTSDDMPGGLVRSVSKVPAKKATITVEVTAVNIP